MRKFLPLRYRTKIVSYCKTNFINTLHDKQEQEAQCAYIHIYINNTIEWKEIFIWLKRLGNARTKFYATKSCHRTLSLLL